MTSHPTFFLHRCAALLPLILTFSIYCVAASESASVVKSALQLPDPLESEWALGDLDGDGKTDTVIGEQIGDGGGDYLYQIELNLSREEGSGSFNVVNADGLG